MLLEIETERVEPGITVVKLKGKVTLGKEAQGLEAMANQLVKQERMKLVFDLSQVQYMDSTGVGTLAYCCSVARKSGGELRLAAAGGKVLQALKLTRMDTVLPFHPTVEAACVAFGAAAKA